MPTVQVVASRECPHCKAKAGTDDAGVDYVCPSCGEDFCGACALSGSTPQTIKCPACHVELSLPTN